MKVAVAADGRDVAGHFGRCERFVVVRIEDGRVVDEEEVACPPHQPGVVPAMLRDLGVDAVICGGIGPRAVGLLEAAGIEVFPGVAGSVADAVEHAVRGQLRPGTWMCEGGGHGGQHGHLCRP